MLSTFTGTTEDEMVAGQLYPAVLEFRENYGAAEARLLWRSDSQPLEVPILALRLFRSGLLGIGLALLAANSIKKGSSKQSTAAIYIGK